MKLVKKDWKLIKFLIFSFLLLHKMVNSFPQVDTNDVSLFGTKAASLIFESYDGGRDSKERLTQV